MDNALTPGFDVFNCPRVAHAMFYVYRHFPIPTQKEISKHYQSDMLTAYGDYYVLFGPLLAIPVFFVIGFVFSRLYDMVGSDARLMSSFYKSILLMFFYSWLSGFGLDWFVIDVTRAFPLLLILVPVQKWCRRDQGF